MVINAIRMVFDSSRGLTNYSANGIAGGVKTHENGIFLYRSAQADQFMKTRAIDYLGLTFFGLWITGGHPFAYIPFIYYLLQAPSNLPAVMHFTLHAELLPHSEQVVFHKSSFFGVAKRVIVDIKNLEKIEAESVPSKWLFTIRLTLLRQVPMVGEQVRLADGVQRQREQRDLCVRQERPVEQRGSRPPTPQLKRALSAS